MPPTPEQGLLSLDEMAAAPALPSENPCGALWLMLLSAAAQSAADGYLDAFTACRDAQKRRELALLKRAEEERSLALASWESALPPGGGRTAAALMLGLELSAALAQRLPEGDARHLIAFLVPEWLDMLYRFINLTVLRDGPDVEKWLGGCAEIMPGRPLTACQRHPHDGIFSPAAPGGAAEIPLLAMTSAVRAALWHLREAAADETDALARGLYLEMALAAGQHLTALTGLLPHPGAPECLMRLYRMASWLHASCALQEGDSSLGQFSRAQQALDRARISTLCVLFHLPMPGSPPEPLHLGLSKGAVRDTLEHIGMTLLRDQVVPVDALHPGADYFRYQKLLYPHPLAAPSRRVIEEMIRKCGADARFEIAPHPVEALRRRTEDAPGADR